MSGQAARDETVERFRFEHGLRRRVVVCGPPCSGKTTLVDRDKRPGDLVWDWDRVSAAMLGDERTSPGWSIRVFEAMRDALIRAVVDSGSPAGVWVIVSSHATAMRIARNLRAQVIVMETDEGTCLRRADEASRIRKSKAAIRGWFRRYRDGS